MGADFPHLDETVVATARYLERVAGLTEEDVRAPSLLPGWTRAHVITHLARNADALADALRAVQRGELPAMYPSQEQRDADIEDGAGRPVEELRADAVASAGRWHQAANELHVSLLNAPVSRLPGDPTWPVSRVGSMRLTEVEVHHADLGAGYTAEDWSAAFLADLMERRRRELAETGPAFHCYAIDTGERWSSSEGAEGPQVTGRSADLLWWLLGRGSGEHLQATHGTLPELGRWA